MLHEVGFSVGIATDIFLKEGTYIKTLSVALWEMEDLV